MKDQKSMEKLHYHLVSGEIIFQDSNGNPGTHRLNCTVTTENGNVRAREIGKAQKLLQMIFFKKMNIVTLNVKDVFIIGISNLGRMTQKEFEYLPSAEAQSQSSATIAERIISNDSELS